MGWNAADIPDQHGRTAVVTGANGGRGLETARQRAAKGAHVVMAVRNQEKAAAALQEIRTSEPDASLELVALDLASRHQCVPQPSRSSQRTRPSTCSSTMPG
jgi:NAD(P)-dependent dehydrogenase (short-subunit alcohol dehydrogenase family)